MSDVTQILGAIQQGDPKAADELLPLVYQELRRLAVFNRDGARNSFRFTFRGRETLEESPAGWPL